jgi:raffinose/stachyose/melibiose transport system permease protein
LTQPDSLAHQVNHPVAATDSRPPGRTGRGGPAGGPRRTRQGRQGRRPARRAADARLLSLPSRMVMWGGLIVGLAVFVLFGIVPVAANMVVSFTNYSGLAGSSTSFDGFTNYLQLVTTQRPGFVASLVATVIFVVGVTVVQNAIGMMLAHRLQADGRMASFLRILVFLPIVLGVTVVGLIWLLLFDPSGSPGTSAFSALGVHSSFFGSNTAAMPLVIVVQVCQNLGFTMVVFVGGLKAIPRSVYDAAALDGVTPWRRFHHITWPLMAPSVTVNVLLAVIGSLTTYNLIYVLTDGAFNTDTLGMLAFNSAFGPSADLGYGAAVTTVLFVVALLVALPLATALRARERRLLS